MQIQTKIYKFIDETWHCKPGPIASYVSVSTMHWWHLPMWKISRILQVISFINWPWSPHAGNRLFSVAPSSHKRKINVSHFAIYDERALKMLNPMCKSGKQNFLANGNISMTMLLIIFLCFFFFQWWSSLPFSFFSLALSLSRTVHIRPFGTSVTHILEFWRTAGTAPLSRGEFMN